MKFNHLIESAELKVLNLAIQKQIFDDITLINN